MLDGLRRKNCIAGEMKKPISLESLEGLNSQVLDR
jgi:hypothetical protein